MLADLSPDGRTVLFNETREGGGAGSAVYLRRADAVNPVRIGDGFGDALSPDGKLVFCHAGSKLVVLPTGSGEARELKIVGAFDRGAVWLPDSRHVVVAGATPEHGYQLLILDTLDEAVKPNSPENIARETTPAFSASPARPTPAGLTKEPTIALHPDGGRTA